MIPSYCRPAALGRCLTALAEQDFAPTQFEVIVVDDGSDPPLGDTISGFGRRLSLTVLRQENAGPGAARNRGASAARGSLLAFTDDDCLPGSGWLSALAEKHAENPGDLLGGRLRNHDSTNLYAEAAQLIVDSAYCFCAEHPETGRFFASNNMAVPASEFASVGGFDADFRIASEDRDLCDRWLQSGRNLQFAGGAIVSHDPHLHLRGFIRQFFNYGRGAYQFHRARKARHRTRAVSLIVMRGRFLGIVLRQLARHPVRNRLRIGALLLLWELSNFAGYLYGAIRNGADAGRRNKA
ncbi:MAG: glycosyltransferase [Lysobacterales bacterium]